MIKQHRKWFNNIDNTHHGLFFKQEHCSDTRLFFNYTFIHSFICSNHFILFKWICNLFQEKNGHKVGICPEWDTSPSQSIMQTRTHTTKANLKYRVHLLACFWGVGGNRRTLSKLK